MSTNLPIEALFPANNEDENLAEDPGRACYRAALSWTKRGYNVVPCQLSGAKYPSVAWKELQDRPVTKDELLAWFPKFAGGVGLITGAISGVIVIETDGEPGEVLLKEFERQYGDLPVTLTIRSGSGRGLHRHYKHPGHKVKTQANSVIKIDVKGDGGFCVLPPSKHKSGGHYEVLHDTDPAELPRGLLEFIESKAMESKHQTSKSDLKPALSSKDRSQNNVARYRTEIVGNCVYQHPPVNPVNVARVQSMLAALPERYADDYDLWLRTGFAVYYFDEGDVGLALWTRFSTRCPDKAKDTDFKKLWSAFGRDYAGNRITLGWLTAQAKANGWVAPCRWDYSTKIAI